MGLAVLPASVCWIAQLVSAFNANLIILGGFLMCIVQDSYSLAYPPWYKSFRIIFSSAAVFSFVSNILLFHSFMD